MNDNPDYKCSGCEFGCIANALNSLTNSKDFHSCEAIYREFCKVPNDTFCLGQYHSDSYPDESLNAAMECNNYMKLHGVSEGYELYETPTELTDQKHSFYKWISEPLYSTYRPAATTAPYDPNTKLVVVFNGPPGSGKDTIVDHLMRKTFLKRSVGRTTFKKALVRQVQSLFSISEDSWWLRYESSSSTGDRMKDVPWDVLDGISQREALIAMSEDFTKPTFGKDYYGKALLKEIRSKSDKVILVSDGGFKEEIKVLEDADDITVMIIQLSRHGCSFKGDSRKYIVSDKIKTTFHLSVHDGRPFTDAGICSQMILSVAKSVKNLQF